jgi:hypothetical protein
MSAKSMLLYSSDWEGIPTFRLMPITSDCPYLEMIFMPRHQGLGIMNRQAKQMFKFIDKVDDKGNIVMIKGTNQPAQERKLVNVEYEYFIINKEEIANIIELFATNVDSFDYKKYFIDMKVKEEVNQ